MHLGVLLAAMVMTWVLYLCVRIARKNALLNKSVHDFRRYESVKK